MHVEETRQDRQRALLDCNGAPSCGKWVPHDFHAQRPVGVTSVSGEMETAWEEVYRCIKCGAERRWGISCQKWNPPKKAVVD